MKYKEQNPESTTRKIISKIQTGNNEWLWVQEAIVAVIRRAEDLKRMNDCVFRKLLLPSSGEPRIWKEWLIVCSGSYCCRYPESRGSGKDEWLCVQEAIVAVIRRAEDLERMNDYVFRKLLLPSSGEPRIWKELRKTDFSKYNFHLLYFHLLYSVYWLYCTSIL